MRIQMVCLANSQVERGRIVIGVLMENGLPLKDDAGPKWLHLVMDAKRNTVPTGLVVDILPRDIIELDTLASSASTKCPGAVIFDPYSLRLVGTMTQETVIAHCLDLHPHILQSSNQPLVLEGCALVNASNCSIVHKEVIELKFELGDMHYSLPIRDPWFLDVLEAEPDILENCPSNYIVVRQKKARRFQEIRGSVMTVML